jgi:streptomycin 6-kinase
MIGTLDRYLSRWQLSDPKPLARTFTSDLYTVQVASQPAVLKILSEIGVEDERAGADALQWYNGQGAVQLLDHDSGAMLLEFVGGNSLTQMVKDGHDDQATRIIADVLNRLQCANSSEPPTSLIPLSHRFRSLLEDGAASQLDPIIQRGATVARSLLRDQRPPHVLHGDIHHDNIRHHPQRGWLAIDPKGLVGERTYDAANALCNPESLPELAENPERLLRQAEIIATGLGIDQPRILAYTFAHACLSACWSVEDGQDPRHALVMARVAESSIGRTSPTRTLQPNKSFL